MLQQRVDSNNSCAYLCYGYKGENVDFIKNLDTSNAEDMSYMFAECSSLTSLDLIFLDTSKITNMKGMFSYCKSLAQLPQLDTTSVTDMESMFSSCSNLTNIDLSIYNTSNVTNMRALFSNNATNLNTIKFSNQNTSKTSNMISMFNSCSNLTTIIGLNLINAKDVGSMFNYCKNLTNLDMKNIKVSIIIGASNFGTLLTNESLINTIKELWDNTNNALGGSRTLTLSSTSKNNIANIYVKLIDVTDEMLAQDEYAGNKKPCVVCEPTDEGAMTLTEYATSKNWAIA
jgi:surface protein